MAHKERTSFLFLTMTDEIFLLSEIEKQVLRQFEVRG
jgi:hypothetical protein